MVQAHLVDELEIDPARIDDSTNFRSDLEADSLDLYTLVQELEDSYGVKMTDEQAARIATVSKPSTSSSPTPPAPTDELIEHGGRHVEWQAMVVLGAFHGINPGMGWLFAVALGMQAGQARCVWRALPPIALGHGLAVGAVLLIAAFAEMIIPLGALRIGVACCLVTLGGYRLWRHRHPRFGGMRVGFRDLTVWSFLMASAHGAGFMVLPFVMAMPADAVAAVHGHAGHGAGTTTLPAMGAIALAIHTCAYLTTTALAAHVVYRKLGLSVLRTAWFNLDAMWAGALLVTGLVVLLS